MKAYSKDWLSGTIPKIAIATTTIPEKDTRSPAITKLIAVTSCQSLSLLAIQKQLPVIEIRIQSLK